MEIKMSIQQYDALISLAREATKGSSDRTNELSDFVSNIDQANNVRRFLLWVRWQELGAPPPRNMTRDFSQTWPPAQQKRIERTDRPIAKADVLELLKIHSRKYGDVFVTRDPDARVGWTKLEVMFP